MTQVAQLRPHRDERGGDGILPGRERLAAAIEKVREAQEYVDRVGEAQAMAETAFSAASRALDHAGGDLEDAERNDLMHRRALLLGDTPRGLSVDDAKTALARAQEDIDLAKKNVDALKVTRRLPGPAGELQSAAAGTAELEWAQFRLKDAIREVVQSSPGIARVFAEWLKVRLRYAQLSTLLEGLNGRSLLPPVAQHWDAIPGVPDPALIAEQRATLASWDVALKALESDPNAQLPDA